ncbi:hypothetical protein Tco_1243139 [Tanacetum coccineum]
MASQDARLSKFEADFKQQQGEMTNKIDTVLKAINDRITRVRPSDKVKNPKLNVNSTSLVLSARSYPTKDPQCSSHIHGSINAITMCSKQPNKSHNDQPQDHDTIAEECKTSKEEGKEEKGDPENINTTRPHHLIYKSGSSEKKFNDGDVMFIEIIKKYDDSFKEELGEDERSYFPTYSGHCTPSKNTTIEILRNVYFNPIWPNTEFNYDSEDMELDEEAGYTTDEESVMSEQEAINPAYAINTQSFEEELSFEEVLDKWEECRVIRKNRKISASKDDLKKSSQTKENTINNDNFTRNFPSQPSLEDLNLGSFLLPFIIASYNSYAMANIDACNNVLPRSIYEYLELANLWGASMSMDYMMQ